MIGGRSYYFAYGSNMDLGQMRERCPDSEFVGIAVLEGYRFVYDGYSRTRQGAVANIEEDPASRVYGVLFLISEEDEQALDRYEGYPRAYDKKRVRVKDAEGREYEALVYWREPREEGMPSEEYEEIIVSAAEEFGFPEDYISDFLKCNR